MDNELQRLINNLNQVEVKGKQNMLILTDAITTLENMFLNERQKEQEELNEKSE